VRLMRGLFAVLRGLFRRRPAYLTHAERVKHMLAQPVVIAGELRQPTLVPCVFPKAKRRRRKKPTKKPLPMRAVK
jgi:hypothetical protein